MKAEDSSLCISFSFGIYVCSRYEQYVEDAYVAYLKNKGQAEQVISLHSVSQAELDSWNSIFQ